MEECNNSAVMADGIAYLVMELLRGRSLYQESSERTAATWLRFEH